MGGADSLEAAPLSDDVQRQFRWTRTIMFLCILIGYSSYYITRNSFIYTAPVMVDSPQLSIRITDVGVITSLFPICYGVSKFVSGVLSDKLQPHVMLGIGLSFTGMINILFGFGSTMTWFCVLWALNGVLQGFGAPACAKILTAWFATKERGTYWGMWNIAHNLGGFAAPLLAGFCARSFGWSWGMWGPGLVGVVVGLVVLGALKDSPESVGFPSAEAMARVRDGTALAAPADSPVVDTTTESHADGADAGSGPQVPLLQNLFQNVLSNPYIWGLALVYFCVYSVRQGVTSWSVFYLLQEKGVSDAGQAAARVSGLELGGLLGSLIAGRLSDDMIKSAPDVRGAVGKRLQVVMLYIVGIALSLAVLYRLPASLPWWAQWVNVFMIGFFLYGPQMLIGLCGAEIVGRHSVGASEGFLGWVAYLGAASAGVPLSMVVDRLGWSSFFVALCGACALALILLLPMVRVKSHVERVEDGDASPRWPWLKEKAA